MTVTVDQLRNLADRAARGPLTGDEQARLRDGINQLEALQAVARGYCPDCGRGDAAPTVTDWEQQRQRADRAETALAGVRTLRDRWVKAGPPPLGTSISRWWDRRLVELAAALNTPPANDTLPTRHVHVTITNPDEYTTNRAALSLADFIAAEFPGHHVTTDAREWEQPGPG